MMKDMSIITAASPTYEKYYCVINVDRTSPPGRDHRRGFSND